MKNKYFFFTVLLFIHFLAFNLFHGNARAGNIMGSDITWVCYGKDTFSVKLILYRDCNGVDMSAAPINFSCKSGSWSTSITPKLPQGIEITPTCGSTCTRCSSSTCSFPYGIQKFIFVGMVILKDAPVACCEVTLSFSMIARNTDITTGASNQNFYTEAMMNRCVSPCASSPQFTNDPIAIICTGQDYLFDPGTSMPPGAMNDSIAFSLTPPLQDSGSPASWVNPYNYYQPIFFWGFPSVNLPVPRGFHLDSLTGGLQFRPMKVEQTIVAIKVSQFRKGIKIGETREELQIIVMNCPVNHSPTLGPAIYYKEVCAGSTVTFTINTNDIDTADQVYISWNHGIMGATWTENNGNVKHPTGTFSWTTNDAQASDISYTFTVTAKDNACPIANTITHAYQVLVKPIPDAAVTITDSGRGIYSFHAKATKGLSPTFFWQGANFTFTPNTGSTTSHKFTSVGNYPWAMTITAQACQRTLRDTLKILTIAIDGNEPVKTHTVIIPNPVKGVSILKTVYTGSKNSMVIFYNSSGKEIRRGYLINKEFEIRQKDFGKGVFFYKLVDREKVIDNGRFVIE